MGLLPYGQPTLDDAKEFYNIAFKFYCEIDNLINKGKK